MPESPNHRISQRIRTRRDDLGLSQEDLSRMLGLNDRQTLSAIESGNRPISPEELVRMSEVLDVEVEYFADPFRLEGEGHFSFRARGVRADVLDGFKAKAGRWVATYRELTARAGIPDNPVGQTLNLTKTSSYEDAQRVAEGLRRVWNLGSVPSRTLEEAVRRNLGALVLHVDAPDGVSGAATYLPGLHAILINRSEPPGRRMYDLAHEVFHLMTWDAMPPAPVEDPDHMGGKRVEQLADNFAAALLMPAETLAGLWPLRNEKDIHIWLNNTADALGVSSVALKWRLRVVGYLKASEVEAIDDSLLAFNGHDSTDFIPPPLFGVDFVRRVHSAVEAGDLSMRRAARLLDVTLSDFAALCRQYGLPLSYDRP